MNIKALIKGLMVLTVSFTIGCWDGPNGNGNKDSTTKDQGLLTTPGRGYVMVTLGGPSKNDTDKCDADDDCLDVVSIEVVNGLRRNKGHDWTRDELAKETCSSDKDCCEKFPALDPQYCYMRYQWGIFNKM